MMLSILTRDLLLNMLLGLVALVVLVLAQINPVAKNNPDSAKPPGQAMVCIYWTGFDDVDLWGRSPDQDKPTGYPPDLKSGKTVDLVRDDLGTDNAPHFECQFARSLPDGRFVWNIHGYRIGEPEVKVHAEIRIADEFGYHLLLERDLTIKQGQERTIAQFQMRGGKVVSGSVNEVLQPLRSAAQ